jgi:hypothetical protein
MSLPGLEEITLIPRHQESRRLISTLFASGIHRPERRDESLDS